MRGTRTVRETATESQLLKFHRAPSAMPLLIALCRNQAREAAASPAKLIGRCDSLLRLAKRYLVTVP